MSYTTSIDRSLTAQQDPHQKHDQSALDAKTLQSQTFQQGPAEFNIVTSDNLWDVNMSRADLYAGTVLEPKPSLRQHLLLLLAPTVTNPSLVAASDVFLSYVHLIEFEFKRRGRRNNKRCARAHTVLSQETALYELLQNYRRALFSG